MKLTPLIFIVIILSSCGNTSVSSTDNTTDSSQLSSDIVRPAVVDSTPNAPTGFTSNTGDKRIKAIEDIYFGIPSSDHFKYFNRQIALGECNFKVKYLGYNDHSLGDNTISGLYSLRLNSEAGCSDIGYLVKLFSAKYGQPDTHISNETVGIPELKDIREIEKWDNSYVAMMEGSLPGVSDNQKQPILFITDENTNFPNNEIVQKALYKWETDSISIELNEGYEYIPIGSKKTFNYKGPKSGGIYNCEPVEKFILVRKPVIDFIHRATEIKLKQFLDQQKTKGEKDKFKNDSDKL